MTKTLHKAKWAVLAFIFLFFSLCSICGGAFGAPASAATNVLEDLQRDENFNIDDYPEKLTDYSLNVIQIAESADGELFIYVYQPSGQGAGIYASSINIGRDKNNTLDLSFPNYKLEYLNSEGVFYKYKVAGFELKEDNERYYNISNILRPFQYLYDDVPENGNKVSEVPYRVGQLWTAFTIDGEVTYEMTGSDVIEITQKYVGFVKINGGVKIGAKYIYGKYTYKNFVAFSTDLPIERLIQAEVQYSLCDVSFSVCANPFCGYHAMNGQYNERRGEPEEQEPKTLYADKKSENIDFGWGGHKYTWYDIQSTEEFINDNNNSDYKLTTEGENNIEGTQWVLNFHNAEFSAKVQAAIWDNHIHYNGQTVQDVMILRLMFETDGETYNLGVVDNKQTGSGKADNVQIVRTPLDVLSNILNKIGNWFLSLFNLGGWFGKLLLIVVIVVAILFAIKLLLGNRGGSNVTVTTAAPNNSRTRTPTKKKTSNKRSKK